MRLCAGGSAGTAGGVSRPGKPRRSPFDLSNDAASQPAKASVDGQSVEQHPLKDQIEADRYLASKAAARKPGLGIKFAKIVPPGSV